MLYSFAANLLLIVHLLFIVFVVLGALLILKWRWLVYLHLPAVIWGVLIEFNHWVCPLTPWENQLRLSAGEAGYNTGFIEHYLLPLIYPANLTDNIQVILGSLVIIINLTLYTWLGLKLRNKH